jgi:peptide/nickel transport system substrate-binding protein
MILALKRRNVSGRGADVNDRQTRSGSGSDNPSDVAPECKVLTRRRALAVILSVSGAALLAACGPTVAPPMLTQAAPAPTQAPPAATPAPAVATQAQPAATQPPPAATAPPAAAAKPAVAPKTGGTLRFGQIGDLVNLDPHFNQGSSENTWLPYDRLTTYDLSFQPHPMLAESWDVNSDATQVKLNLRKGVQFHSGREMTSDDVKYSILRVRDPKIGVAQYTAQSNWFQSVETPDKYTIVLKSDNPRPLMFDFLEVLNIADKDVVDGADAKSKDGGTGPFIFSEWAPGDHATYTRNPNYWQTGRPYVDAVSVVFLRDAQAMIVQLEAGALDLIRNPTKQEFVRLKANPQYQAIQHPASASAYGLGLNCKRPPLDNKKVRQALNYAIDRGRFVDSILKGVGTPLSLPWAESFPMYETSKAHFYSFDLDNAKALLTAEGVSDVSLEMIPNPGDPDSVTFAEMYQGDLAKIGINLNIMKLDMAAWSDQVNGNKFGAMYVAGSNLALSPGTIFTVSRPIGPVNNNEGFESEQYGKLVSDLAVETDLAKQKFLYSRLNDILLDEAFFNFLSPNYFIGVADSKVHEVTPNMHGGWYFIDTWLAA